MTGPHRAHRRRRGARLASTLVVLGIALSGCGDAKSPAPKPPPPKPVALEYLLPDCDACSKQWRGGSERLRRVTRLRPVMLGRPGSANERVAAVTEWAHARGRSSRWLDVWFDVGRSSRSVSTGLEEATRRLGLDERAAERAVEEGLPAARRNWRETRRIGIKTAPTLVLRGRSVAVLAGGWTDAQLDAAIVRVRTAAARP